MATSLGLQAALGRSKWSWSQAAGQEVVHKAGGSGRGEGWGLGTHVHLLLWQVQNGQQGAGLLQVGKVPHLVTKLILQQKDKLVDSPLAATL